MSMEISTKRVLILGGTGAMGVHLCELLSDHGMSVTVTSRTPRKPHGNIQYLLGNAKDHNFLKPILEKKWDCIVDFMVYKTEEFQQRSDILLQSTKHYLFLSSARVYANSAEPITENSPRLLDVCKDSAYLATDEYALTKARQENILFASAHKNWTVIRPYITYSKDRLQLGTMEKEDWLFRTLQGKKILMTEELLACKTTLTSGLEVASQIAALIMASEQSFTQIYNTVGENGKTWDEIRCEYQNALEKKGAKLRVLVCSREAYLKGQPARYQYLYDRLYNRMFDNTKIAAISPNSSPHLKNLKLQQCVTDFLAERSFKTINWSLEGSRDRQCSERPCFLKLPGIKNKAKYMKNYILG